MYDAGRNNFQQGRLNIEYAAIKMSTRINLAQLNWFNNGPPCTAATVQMT